MQEFINSVRFEVFTAVTMKNDVFWDVTPYGSCRNQYLEEDILQNVGSYKSHMALHPRRHHSSFIKYLSNFYLYKEDFFPGS
jgi:hypothetical protein